jgi:hypothetical protein
MRRNMKVFDIEQKWWMGRGCCVVVVVGAGI